MATVLIVDDEKSICVMVSAFLGEAGHSVWSADGVAAARAVLKDHSFDVAVIDLCLGDGSGTDVAGLLREQQPRSQIIICTGEPGLDSARKAIRLRAFDYLVKPVGKEQLLDVVSRAAEEKRRLDEYERLDAHRERLEEEVSKRTAEVVAERDRAQGYLDVAGVMLMVLNDQQTITMINNRGCDILGAPREQIVGKNWFDTFLPPELRADTLAVYVRLLAGELTSVEYHKNAIVRADGCRRDIAWHNALLKDNDGKVVGLLCSGEDVSERERAEAELAEREQYFRGMMYGLHEDIIVLDADRCITDVNNTFVKSFGLSREDVIGRHCYEVMHGYSSPCETNGETCHFQDVLRKGESQNCTHLRKRADGTMAHVNVLLSPLRDRQGDVIGVVEVIRDVTDIVTARDGEAAATKELAQSEAKLRSIIDNIGTGVALIGPKMDVLDLNRQMRDWFPLIDVDQCPTCYRVFNDPPQERVCSHCPICKTFQDGRVHESVMMSRYLDGVRQYRVVSSPILGDDGKVIAAVKMVEDMTERLELEAQLRQSQKLESIGTLAGGVAHEINNPINGIMNYAQLILDRLGLDSPVAEFVEEIGHETERVALIVKNLLAFARREKQERSKVSLQEVVNGALSLVRTVLRQDRIALDVDVPEDLPSIICHSQQVQQVLMNLVTNARDALNAKYTGHAENKRISITVRAIEEGGKPWVRISVEDNGQGIPDDVRERMFEPFYTTKPKGTGTGLGLSISYGIVRDHGGKLRVETVPGESTRFDMDLPVASGYASLEDEWRVDQELQA